MDIEDKERMGSCKEGARKNHCVAVQIEDLMKAVGRLNSKEAAGMDGVPGIIIKLIFKHRAHDVLNMINFIYEKAKYLGSPPSTFILAHQYLTCNEQSMGEQFQNFHRFFCRGRSTVNSDFCRKKNLICILMAIDNKNAFTILRRETIINKAK